MTGIVANSRHCFNVQVTKEAVLSDEDYGSDEERYQWRKENLGGLRYLRDRPTGVFSGLIPIRESKLHSMDWDGKLPDGVGIYQRSEEGEISQNSEQKLHEQELAR